MGTKCKKNYVYKVKVLNNYTVDLKPIKGKAEWPK